MSFLLFLRGFAITMIVFAIANYAITQSAWATVVNTVICAVLIQIGYFVAVLFMVWRHGASEKRTGNASSDEPALMEGGKPKDKASPLSGVGRSRLP
ncbi:exopolysaccharide production repressor protein [Pseudaminobacter salicylatoxidans]|uniref:exopolysaccharide production repressor protein n=1 Tax=Pseudaminobacter salicylatoxidans TaxID=93369 RepID=UPI000303764B|nr:exopolysaccharide production repressor protein [Pseudaminobacter salicylatoxidans]